MNNRKKLCSQIKRSPPIKSQAPECPTLMKCPITTMLQINQTTKKKKKTQSENDLKNHIQTKLKHSYLLKFAISRSHKSHSVAAVIIRRHRGHAIIFIYEERDPFNGAGPS